MGFLNSLITGKPYERNAYECPEGDWRSKSRKATEKHIDKKHGGKDDGKGRGNGK